MRIIFLDIDGVFNSEIFYRERYRKSRLTIGYWLRWLLRKSKWVLNGFRYKAVSYANYTPPKSHKTFKYRFDRFREETCIDQLQWIDELCNNLNLKVVISSVWRTHFSIEEWNKAFEKLKLTMKVVGVTEINHSLRGDEIKDWIEQYGPVENYIIIDDDRDMLTEQMDHFFKIDNYCGLTPSTLGKIEKFLIRDKPNENIIQICFDEHIKSFDGKVKFTFEQYYAFWKNYQTGANYKMKNRDGSTVECKIVYYPLPYYSDLRAIIEIPMKGGFDFRDVPVHFLQKI